MSVTAHADHALARYRDEFPIFRESIYLNSCSLGALSRRSRLLTNRYLDLWESRGAAAWYDIWLPALDELRQRYGRLVGAAPGTIALHPSISSALGAVGESLDYGARPKVITTALDFPTVAYQWLAKAGNGVSIEILPSPDGVGVPLDVFQRAIDDRTALVATSHVFFTTGAIQDVGTLADLCHARGTLLLVDGYHAAGQIPVDLARLDADFYCSGGLKWLLGGSGITFLYVNPARTAGLCPRVTGWFADSAPFRFDPSRWSPRSDARRFEGGTPAMGSVYAQLGGLNILEEIGSAAIRAVTSALTEDLLSEARAAGLHPKAAARVEDRSAIVMLPREDPERDVRRLAEAHIVADARPGYIRLSPFFYNVMDDHRAALELLSRA